MSSAQQLINKFELEKCAVNIEHAYSIRRHFISAYTFANFYKTSTLRKHRHNNKFLDVFYIL